MSAKDDSRQAVYNAIQRVTENLDKLIAESEHPAALHELAQARGRSLPSRPHASRATSPPVQR
jgi:hypothetical protein